MSTRKQDKAVQSLFQGQISKTNPKQQMHWLLRGLLVIGKQPSLSTSGFVLPTVAMVSLVIVLLSTAMVIRAFERAKYASNVRVNEAVLNAAAPALDRARAKLDALFTDETLPRETPSDLALNNVLTSDKYKLGDETRLKLVSDFGNGMGGSPNTTIESRAGTASKLENDETLTTAWKFPVDTDNNGKFDSYTLYSILFRSPSRGTDGKFNRARNPLEARTPPMSGGTIALRCANVAGTSDSLVGDSDWYKSGAKLTKSFFVYTATVGIINPPTGDASYEAYKGNKGFSALEFQQDRSRIPLVNNAVLFQDDLEVTPNTTFRLNGSILTNANLLIGGHDGAAIRLYQVSSKNSCFYKEENSKITVGGNVGTGNVADTADQTAVTVDLFNGVGNESGTATINSDNKSTTSAGGAQVGYNDAAYNSRIALMKQTALSYSTTNPPTVASVDAISQYPQEVKHGFRAKITAPGDSSLNAQDVLAEQIEIYLKNRTRRVPYAEVAFGANALSTYTSANIFTSGIEPPAAWSVITNSNPLTLNTDNLARTQPEKQRQEGKETYLGDRIHTGNNLPAYWKKDEEYVTGSLEKQFLGSTIKWTSPNTQERYRTTQVALLPDVGISDRNGFWEDAAAQQPAATASNTGGLRVITGAGIYRNGSSSYAALSATSFLSAPTVDSGESIPDAPLLAGETTATPYTLVWPDTMPMTGGIDPVTGTQSTKPPDLRMRTIAVYHYKDSSYTDSNYINRTPTACVSSYYNPTNVTTAKNEVNVDGGYGVDTSNGRSNNGVVYPAPYTTNTARFSAIATYLPELKAQARLMFPNGRIVNEPLQQALQKLNASGGLANINKLLTLSENSAIDTAICAIKILTDSAFTPSTTPKLAHGALKEASFLDARQVKAIDKTATSYDLELEQRQPLEIRVTDIDINQLRGQTITAQQEYMLPNSGIIYASRDDALPDLSDTSAENKLLSSTDFILDPTRRPNGIKLINGSNLERDDDFRAEEKGLILVSNLPVYIRGNFNLHQKSGTTTATEEFTEALTNDWSNFYTRATTLDNNFACRKGQTGCGSNGDQWRPATIIADAITLLSNTFTDGFRNLGDYDLRNNAGSAAQAYKNNGFYNNSFVTSANWADTDGFPSSKNSYLTNGVTPIQRRVRFSEYLMEYCPKIPVSECTNSDWVINTNGAKASDTIGAPFTIGTHQAGTTAQAASSTVERYTRRIAFKRNSGTLELKQVNGEPTPIPLGINSAGNIDEFPYDTYSTKAPRLADNALWFRTTTNTSGKPYNDPSYQSDKPLAYTENITSNGQPSLVPVLQIHSPEGTPNSTLEGSADIQNKWIQAANDTTFNAVFVSGNSPSRPTEESAGLHNLVRLLENWSSRTLNIKGSFMQFKRSAYATAPFATILAAKSNDNDGTLSIFGYSFTQYKTDNGEPDGTLPYYKAPTEQWSFDVGILSQSPDLFAQKFTLPVAPSHGFFREVSRDEPWIQPLLCAAQGSGTSYTYAIDASQRPTTCPALTSYNDS